MSHFILPRLWSALCRHGFWGSGYRLVAMAVDRLFDVRHGVETGPPARGGRLAIQVPRAVHGNGYEPTRILPLRRVLRLLKPRVPPEAGLVDLGCGKGRVLMVAAREGFQTVRGVECDPELCEVAERNLGRFRASSKTGASLSVVNADASRYAFQADENLFFLFNPFGEAVLRPVLENLDESLAVDPRPALIVFHHMLDRDWSVLPDHWMSVLDCRIHGYAFRAFANGLSWSFP